MCTASFLPLSPIPSLCHLRTAVTSKTYLLTYTPFWITTLPHVLYALQTLTCCLFLVFALPLHPVVLVLQPPQSGTHSHLAFATLPLPILSVAFLKLAASSRPSAPPSGSPKCLRFGHLLTLCTLNIHLLTYLLKLHKIKKNVTSNSIFQWERKENHSDVPSISTAVLTGPLMAIITMCLKRDLYTSRLLLVARPPALCERGSGWC